MDGSDKETLRVLWVSLVEFPPLCEKLGTSAPDSCGWMWSSAKVLLKMMPELKMGVIVYSYSKKYIKYDVDGISYYLVPCHSMHRTSEAQVNNCRQAIDDFRPQFIHIHGTEHSLARAVCEANKQELPIVANIQGLGGGILPFTDGGLSLWSKFANITLLDFYRGTFMISAKSKMAKRAKNEREVIERLTDIIGRTQWDYDHAITMNPNIRYHFMNETLRDSFYEKPIWSYENCKKHTIFVSNSGVPLKGAHQVLKALPIIIQKYPDVKVCFCGSSVMSNDWKSIIRFQGYHVYLRRLVKKLNLQEHVHFLGVLNEKQMKQAFLDANVYVLPSAIENSPNSLCEAQILGVPTIAAYVGGVPTLVEESRTGYMYRYEEIEMLAQTVIRLFGQTDFEELSRHERDVALRRHDRKTNASRLVEIYKIIGEKTTAE